jgi:hypothetical protein
VLLLLTAAYYSIKMLASLVRHLIQARIGKPSLIVEADETLLFPLLPLFCNLHAPDRRVVLGK